MIIFPSDALYELRRNLVAQMDSGELSEADGFRQALEADPNYSMALLYLGLAAEREGSLEEAERLARLAIRNHPSGHQAYILLQRLVAARNSDSPLVEGYSQLGLKKILWDEDALEKMDFRKLAPQLAPGSSDIVQNDMERSDIKQNQETLQALIDHLEAQPRTEPPEIATELEPHRLIHQLREAGADALATEVTRAILARAEACGPMLMGILKEFGEDLLEHDDDAMVMRALALLGEMGDPAALPEISEFLLVEEEHLAQAADWAFGRIAFRRPAESLQVIRGIAPKAEALHRAILAQQLCQMPDVAGRLEVLASLAEGMESYSSPEQESLLLNIIASAWAMQGVNGELGQTLQQRYGSVLAGDSRKELKKIRAELASLPPFYPTEDEISVYDICGDDSQPVETVVHETPKLGRNDPCWCGSGKKYKKCHLEGGSAR
jgi:tetratricopeptide (TPR) repeat protein